MTYEERDRVMEEAFQDVRGLLSHKGKDYGTPEDANANFKEASGAGITHFQAWYVYSYKHWSSIRNAIFRNPEKPASITETLRGRILDLIAYLIILLGMLEEK